MLLFKLTEIVGAVDLPARPGRGILGVTVAPWCTICAGFEELFKLSDLFKPSDLFIELFPLDFNDFCGTIGITGVTGEVTWKPRYKTWIPMDTMCDHRGTESMEANGPSALLILSPLNRGSVTRYARLIVERQKEKILSGYKHSFYW